ncbi:MAG: hypothetical protein M3R65_07320 [Gemmatimonadota bacterium]|nr:hypothetical protein [Gemmatimonadota bacterium]
MVICLAACALLVAPLGAQRVTLRIAPPQGDTLRMQLEQNFEMQSGSPAETVTGAMKVWTHAIVLHHSRGATDLLSVTDSVRVYPSNVALRPLREAQRALEGKIVHLRVDPRGGMRVGSGRDAVFGAGSTMPAMLPEHPVSVREYWTRDMQVPLSATGSSTAQVRTTFRLDSLGDHEALAYISFHGAVSHDHSQDGSGATGKTVGTLSGTMQVDRRLYWITDSQMVVSVVSDVQPLNGPPVHARMRVTQSLRALVGN